MEWLTLPQMILLTGGALKHALYLAENLQVDAAAMRANIARANDVILAESAVFALANAMPRSKAEELVKKACAVAVAQDKPLIKVIEKLANDSVKKGEVDWKALAEPKNYLGETKKIIERGPAKSKDTLLTMEHSSPATLTELLGNRAKQHPDKLALIFKDRRWTYGEFQREVERVANGLIRIGVKKGDRIAFLLPNSAEFLFATFAVTRIGAVFVPLNPQYTAEEAEYVLHHSEASIVLTSPELLTLVDDLRAKLPNLKQVIVTGADDHAGALSWRKFLSGVSDTLARN